MEVLLLKTLFCLEKIGVLDNVKIWSNFMLFNKLENRYFGIANLSILAFKSFLIKNKIVWKAMEGSASVLSGICKMKKDFLKAYLLNKILNWINWFKISLLKLILFIKTLWFLIRPSCNNYNYRSQTIDLVIESPYKNQAVLKIDDQANEGFYIDGICDKKLDFIK